MTNILITEFIDSQSLQNINKEFNVIYKKDAWQNRDYLEKEIHNFDGIIIRNKTNLDESILKKAVNLKFIGRLGVGLDNINTKYCNKNNIFVQPATGMNADSVAEYVINSSLILLKKTLIVSEQTRKGNWPRNTIVTNELKGKTLGLIGFGYIAKKVFKLANSFDVSIITYDPFISSEQIESFSIKKVSFNEILKLSDIISIHVPLSEENKYMFNNQVFSKMEKKPIIINSSRGGIINEKDLLDAYSNNIISGFALDVFENEPIDEEFYKNISKNMNCILTPHTAGVTEESNTRVSDFIIDTTNKFFQNLKD
jgi:phosphoglycerate dehydrogenase-like enzyme